MKNKLTVLVIMLAVLFVGTNFAAKAQDAKAKDGKTIFEESKCTGCHSILAEKIEAKKKNDKYPDLSGVGAKETPEFIKKFLKKEEKKNDKNHPIAFKGEDADFETLVTWLSSLKTENK